MKNFLFISFAFSLFICLQSCKHHDNYTYSIYAEEVHKYDKKGKRVFRKKLKTPCIAMTHISITNDSLITCIGTFIPVGDDNAALKEKINMPLYANQTGSFIDNFPTGSTRLMSIFTLKNSCVDFGVCTEYDIFNRAYKYAKMFTDYDSTQTFIWGDILSKEHESYDEFAGIIKFNKKSSKK